MPSLGCGGTRVLLNRVSVDGGEPVRPVAAAPKAPVATKQPVDSKPAAKPKSDAPAASSSKPATGGDAGTAAKLVHAGTPTPTAKPDGPSGDAKAGASTAKAAPKAATAVKHSKDTTTSSPPATSTDDGKPVDTATRQAIDGAQAKPDDPLPHGLPNEDRQAIIRARASAATVDAAIPKDERDQVVRDQQAALATAKQSASNNPHLPPDDRVSANEVYGEYWKDHKYYVDPKTRTVYRASYDPSTGVVHAERVDDPSPDPAAHPTRTDGPGRGVFGPYLPKGSARPKATAAPRQSSDHASSGSSAGASGAAKSPAHGDQPDRDVLRLNAAPRVAGPDPSIPTPEPGMEASRAAGSPQSSDTTLDVSIDGSQVRTVTSGWTGNGDGTGGTSRTTTHEAPDGSLDSQTRANTRWKTAAGSNTYSTNETSIDGNGMPTNVKYDTRRTDAHGSFERSSATSYVDGKPAHSDSTSSASQGGQKATSTRSIDYVNGAPSTGVTHQSLDTPKGHESGTISVTYTGAVDAFGQPRIGKVTSTGTSGGDLDAHFASGLPAGTTRFTYSTVRNAGGGTSNATPYVTQPGVRTQHHGIDIYVEGGDLAADADGGQRTAGVITTIDGAPPELLTSTRSIDALEGQSPDDVAAGTRYGIPNFVSEADAGGGHVNFYSGAIFNDEPAFWHELGHINGTNGGPATPDAWTTAMTKDRATRKLLLDVPGATIAWDHGERGAFTDESGVTGYASEAYDGPSKTQAEDWAESTQLWIDSQQNGSIATMTLPDGSTRKLTFEDIFPERAKQLRDHYGQLTIPPAPAAIGSGPFGGAIGGAMTTAPPPEAPGHRVPGQN